MPKNISRWLKEEYAIFLQIPAKWHLILLITGLSLGFALGLNLRIYLEISHSYLAKMSTICSKPSLFQL